VSIIITVAQGACVYSSATDGDVLLKYSQTLAGTEFALSFYVCLPLSARAASSVLQGKVHRKSRVSFLGYFLICQLLRSYTDSPWSGGAALSYVRMVSLLSVSGALVSLCATTEHVERLRAASSAQRARRATEFQSKNTHAYTARHSGPCLANTSSPRWIPPKSKGAV
jgi:hypothetical protein